MTGRQAAGKAALAAYRGWSRLRNRSFSVVAGGAFASFGRRTVLQLPVRLAGEQHIELGDDVFVGAGSWLQAIEGGGAGAPELVIGSGTSMSGHCVLSAARSVRLGRGVLLARNVYISDHIHAYRTAGEHVLDQGLDKVLPVEIGDGAWLGQNTVVTPGVRIGRGAVVAANSVVTEDVPAFALAAGAPARVLRCWGPEAPARPEPS